MHDLDVTYLGYPIHFSAGQCFFMNTMEQYNAKADEALKWFFEHLTSKTLDDFVKSGSLCGLAAIERVVKGAVEMLVRNGNYGMTTENFMKQYAIIDDWSELLIKCQGLLADTDETIDAAKATRQLRKDTRGRVIGGGFGLKGAVSGMATAGMMNATSGILHSGANAIGNARTRHQAQKMLDEFYQSDDFRDAVSHALERCVWKVGIGVVVASGYHFREVRCPTSEQSREAANLIENYNMVPAEDRKSVCARILSCDPTNSDVYKFLLKQHKDVDGTLGQIAEAVGVWPTFERLVQEELDGDCGKVLAEFNRQLLTVYLPQFEDKEADKILQQYIEKICDLCAQYGLDPASNTALDYLNRIRQSMQKRLEELQHREQEARTFDGVVYATLEERKEAESTWTKIENLTKDYLEQSTAKITEMKSATLAIAGEAPSLLKSKIDQRVDELDQAWEKADIAERTFLGVVFETRKERKDAEKQWNQLEKAQQKALSAAPEGFRTSQELSVVLEVLHNGFADIHPALKGQLNEKIQALEELLKESDQQERTFKDHLYPTREAYEKACADYQRLFDRYPPASLTSKQALNSARAILSDSTLDSYVVSLYQSEFDKAMSKYMASRISDIAFWGGVITQIILLLAALFVPTLRIDGRTVNSIGMLSVVFSSSETITISMRLAAGAFVLIIDGLLIERTIHLFVSHDAENVWTGIGAVGILMLAALGICFLLGSAVDSTWALRILAIASVLLSIIAISLEGS